MKVIVTGISGFLGPFLADALPGGIAGIGIHNRQPPVHTPMETLQLDLTDQVQVQEIITQIQPDFILHAAALSNPNYCEQHPEASKKVNLEASVYLAKIAAKIGCGFLFVSTDLVFQGDQSWYTPTSATAPLMMYGKHKAQAEKAILNVHSEAIVARIPLLYGFSKNESNNFLVAWLEKIKRGETVYAFEDEFRTSASAACVARGLWLLVQKKMQGIWHLGGRERLSRYDFIVQAAQQLYLPTNIIQPSKQADVTMPAARPADVSLNSEASFALGYHPLTLSEYLESHQLIK